MDGVPENTDLIKLMRDTYKSARATGLSHEHLLDLYLVGKCKGLAETGYECSAQFTTPRGAKLSIWQTEEGKTHIILVHEEMVITFLPHEIYPPLPEDGEST